MTFDAVNIELRFNSEIHLGMKVVRQTRNRVSQQNPNLKLSKLEIKKTNSA